MATKLRVKQVFNFKSHLVKRNQPNARQEPVTAALARFSPQSRESNRLQQATQ
jgi:hypothetical protein